MIPPGVIYRGACKTRRSDTLQVVDFKLVLSKGLCIELKKWRMCQPKMGSNDKARCSDDCGLKVLATKPRNIGYFDNVVWLETVSSYRKLKHHDAQIYPLLLLTTSLVVCRHNDVPVRMDVEGCTKNSYQGQGQLIASSSFWCVCGCLPWYLLLAQHSSCMRKKHSSYVGNWP